MKGDEKELLKFSAKAAGLSLDVSGKNGGANGAVFDLFGNVVLDWHNGVTWNPLRNNADAFWLVAKLELELYTGEDESCKTACAAYFVGDCQRVCIEHHDSHKDVYAAFRYAVVRAAAEIGRSIK